MTGAFYGLLICFGVILLIHSILLIQLSKSQEELKRMMLGKSRKGRKPNPSVVPQPDNRITKQLSSQSKGRKRR